jgi:uncharacterized protein
MTLQDGLSEAPIVDAHGHTLDLAFKSNQRLHHALGGLTDVPLMRAGQPLEAILDATAGWLLFSGQATEIASESREACFFRYLNYRLRGDEKSSGQRCRVCVKNEQHVCWRDGQVVASSPDLIVLVGDTTGRPLTTRVHVNPGSGVAIIGMKTLDDAWGTKPGLQLMAPRHFGFDIDHVPVEEMAIT